MAAAFPHSPEYLARQFAREKALAAAREKLAWTDAQFLAERDEAYIARQRALVPQVIAGIEREIADDSDTEGYVRFYHTDEG